MWILSWTPTDGAENLSPLFVSAHQGRREHWRWRPCKHAGHLAQRFRQCHPSRSVCTTSPLRDVSQSLKDLVDAERNYVPRALHLRISASRRHGGEQPRHLPLWTVTCRCAPRCPPCRCGTARNNTSETCSCSAMCVCTGECCIRGRSTTGHSHLALMMKSGSESLTPLLCNSNSVTITL